MNSACGYADRLKKGAWRGECGLSEKPMGQDVLKKKCRELAEMWKSASHVVVHTGAGISTACGIPDFRGKNGVWTKELNGEAAPSGVSFEQAQPSFTHMALAELVERGFITYIVSQNVDGLHLRSGVPREKLSELHGNIFIERCEDCGREYFGTHETTTVGFKLTGGKCRSCEGRLRDHCLDWDDRLPEYDLEMAVKHSKMADLSICFGTSLQMEPAMNYPVMATKKYRKQKAGSMVICNLSATRMDKHANLIINHSCDTILRLVCDSLDVAVREYSPRHELQVFYPLLEHKKPDSQTENPRPRKKKRPLREPKHSNTKPSPTKPSTTEGPIPCQVLGCRFFGSTETGSLCSKHFALKQSVDPSSR